MAKKQVDWNILINESLNGSERSTRKLIKATERYLNSMSLMHFKTINPDVITETLVKIWENLDKFDSDKAIYPTWITTILKRNYYKHSRKRARRLDKEVTMPEYYDDSLFLAEDAENDSIIYEDMIPALRELLETDERFEFLCHFYIYGMSYADIAIEMDCPLHTVKNKIRKEKRTLKEVFAFDRDI